MYMYRHDVVPEKYMLLIVLWFATHTQKKNNKLSTIHTSK